MARNPAAFDSQIKDMVEALEKTFTVSTPKNLNEDDGTYARQKGRVGMVVVTASGMALSLTVEEI